MSIVISVPSKEMLIIFSMERLVVPSECIVKEGMDALQNAQTNHDLLHIGMGLTNYGLSLLRDEIQRDQTKANMFSSYYEGAVIFSQDCVKYFNFIFQEQERNVCTYTACSYHLECVGYNV